MKMSTLKLSEYAERYGSINARGGVSEETLALWQKIKSLPLVEVLIIEPEKHDGDVEKLRCRLYAKTLKLAKTANFKVAFRLNRREKHVAIMKMAKPN